MKDSQLIKNLKSEMATFLNLHPDNNSLSFLEYFETSRIRNHKGAHMMFLEAFSENMAGIASIPPPSNPNVIFGVLTNGEIFVEVNGQQHTPADGFYKLATIQSTKLAHQVRDLETELMELRRENEELKKNALTPDAKSFIYGLEECMPYFKGESIREVFGYAMRFEPGTPLVGISADDVKWSFSGNDAP